MRYGLAWLSAHWTRLVLLFAALAVLFIPAASQVVDIREFESHGTCLLAFLVVTGCAAVFYWRMRPDFPALVIVIGFADAIFICLGFRLIDEAIGFDGNDAATVLTSIGAMIVWGIAGTGGAALVMRRLRGTVQRASA